MNTIAMLRRFGMLSWLLLCSVAAAAPPADVAGKIDAGTWQRVESGEVRELLILFDSAAIDVELNAHLTRRKIKLEDDTALALRAERYRQIKQSAHAALRANDAVVLREYAHLPMRLVRIGDTAALLRILERPEVAAVMEDAKAYLHLTQSLPLVGQPSVVGTMGRTGTGSTVVVLDTGLTYTRAEFGSCTSPGVPAGCKVVAAFDTATEDGALDANGHGTWVAGTVAGIAPDASIAAIDVFVGNSANSSDIIEGIDWAIANRTTYNIVAINMSLGDRVSYSSPCSSILSNPYRPAIINARNAGILTIASSGNDGFTTGIAQPACTPEAVSVGAVYDANVGNNVNWSDCTDSTSAADKVTCFSNSASFLTLLAPGALITVTGSTVGGTSFSAPLVAGAVAVMAQAFPGDNATNRLARLTGNGTAVTDSRNGIVTPGLNLLAAQGAPGNDSFASASTLTGLAGQSTGWNLNATKETGEPGHAGNSGGKSVWWQWTAPATGTLSLDTHGSGFDTLLGLYTGTSVAVLTTVSSNDNDSSPGNASGLSAAVSAGTSYRIAADGKNGAGGGVTLNWSMQLQAQTISFTQPADLPLGSAFSLGATASSGLPVSYTSQTPAICTVSGDVAILIAAGVCRIAADQAGNANWLPAPQVVRTFNVTGISQLAQTISFAAIGNQTLTTPPFAVSASASSGLPVTIVSLSTASCSITGNTVTLIAVGTCTLQASQAGSATWLAATPVTNFFAITLSSGGGSGEVPLPLWSLLLLGAGLFGALSRQRRAGG